MNTKKILDLMRSCDSAERIYLYSLFEISIKIRNTVRDFNISKDEFCAAMEISKKKYDDYFSGGHNYDLHDIARLETLIFNKIMAAKEQEAQKESEVIGAPKYKYSEVRPESERNTATKQST